MPSDLSRLTFNKEKQYSGVLLQQGRVILDSDWNEQVQIQQYRTHAQTNDVIGKCGVPKGTNAFQISVIGNGTNLQIHPGRIYVNGLLCELTENTITYFSQPYYPNPATDVFNLIGSPPSSPPTSPPSTRLNDGNYIVYIDAWQRERTYLDDPLIQEVALGEADTASRLQTVWQIKLLPVNQIIDCKTDPAEWNALVAPSTGKLNVRTNPVDAIEDPCILPPGAGYKRLENQLYRVEIQNPGNQNTATFKWSRENASVETRIENIQSNVITVESTGKDDVLGFAAEQWVEIVDESSDLNTTPRPLVKIIDVFPSTRQIEVDLQGNSFIYTPGMKLRRWEQYTNADENGVPLSNNWIGLEDGIEVEFQPGTYKAGEYWLIPARTATADVEWPPYNASLPPIAQPPLGIHHGYCKLATLRVDQGNVELIDCRPNFPSLTNICAEDICYDSNNCEHSEAKTVQQALDDLCAIKDQGNGCATFSVAPGPGWERVFDNIKENQDAHICLQIGTYPLTNPAVIQSKGHLKITGCGFGTRIIANSSESALIFEDCDSILIKELYAQTGRIGSKNASKHLNGTITALNCGKVNIERLSLQCGAGASRSATCLTIRNDLGRIGDARVQNSDFSIGHFQQGLLLVNIRHILVENNSMHVYDRPASLTFAKAIKDKRYRAEIRANLVKDTQVGTAKPNTNHSIENEGRTIHFETRANMTEDWNRLIADNPAPNVTRKSRELIQHTNNMASKIIYDPDFRAQFSVFNAFIAAVEQDNTAISTQGITIGGRQIRTVKVLNNTIKGMLQGIHIGLSHQNNSQEPFASRDVLVSGNSIHVTLPFSIAKTERFGIFVGNCDSLMIEKNSIQLERVYERNANGQIIRKSQHPFVEGIRVWGYLGSRVMITQNHVFSVDDDQSNSFDIGIRLEPIGNLGKSKQWVVLWNSAPSRVNTIQLRPGSGARAQNNTP